MEFLLKHELVFPLDSDESDLFPTMSMEWDFPSIISNMIIDVRDPDLINWEDLLVQIEELKCYYLQLRIFDNLPFSYLQKLAQLFYPSLIHGYEIFIKYPDSIKTDQLILWVEANPKLRSIIFYDAPENKIVSELNSGFSGIYFIKDTINSHRSCGVIDPAYFSVNIETFTESKSFNSCLNRKMGIDENGEIKNCPSMHKSFGNIRDTKLIDVANNREFQATWHITKDLISKCKDCEFRYICTDCRAFLENPHDEYSAPLKCGYDPYSGKWQEWAKDPLKHMAILTYNLQLEQK